jgi:hypothetical protein
MSIFPTTPVVKQLQRLVAETFEVSEQDAHDYAAEQVALAEGWGGPQKSEQMNWSYRIRKDLGAKLKWRSQAEREKFEASENLRLQALDAFVRGRRNI